MYIIYTQIAALTYRHTIPFALASASTFFNIILFLFFSSASSRIFMFFFFFLSYPYCNGKGENRFPLFQVHTCAIRWSGLIIWRWIYINLWKNIRFSQLHFLFGLVFAACKTLKDVFVTRNAYTHNMNRKMV